MPIPTSFVGLYHASKQTRSFAYGLLIWLRVGVKGCCLGRHCRADRTEPVDVALAGRSVARDDQCALSASEISSAAPGEDRAGSPHCGSYPFFTSLVLVGQGLRQASGARDWLPPLSTTLHPKSRFSWHAVCTDSVMVGCGRHATSTNARSCSTQGKGAMPPCGASHSQ